MVAYILKDRRYRFPVLLIGILLTLAVFGMALAPQTTGDLTGFVLGSLVAVAPLIIPGILLTAWIAASGAGSLIARAFQGNMAGMVLMAAIVGAITPVCGVAVLPLLAGLLSVGVPLAPIMAFWLSSPITDPTMLAATGAMLGPGFALGKTLAAFGLGLFGGYVTVFYAARPWYGDALRRNTMTAALQDRACTGPATFEPAFWRFADRRITFGRETWAITRLLLICLVPAFAAEFALNAVLQPDMLTAYLGPGAWWAVPAAVFVGAPAYVDGYAALPLARSLIAHGVSPGTAMAFLVSGGVVSIWGAMAILPVLRIQPFLLFLALAIVGSLASGWLYDLAISLAAGPQ